MKLYRCIVSYYQLGYSSFKKFLIASILLSFVPFVLSYHNKYNRPDRLPIGLPTYEREKPVPEHFSKNISTNMARLVKSRKK